MIVVNQYIDPSWLPLFDVKWKDYVELNKELMELLRSDLRAKRKTREEVLEEMRKIPPRGVYLQDFPELKLEEKKGLKYYYDKLLQAKGKSPKQGGSAALNQLLGDKADGMPDNWSHDWSEFEGLSDAEKHLIRSQTDQMLREVAEQVKKSRGLVPSEISGYLDMLDKKEPPKFDWKKYLRRFAGGSDSVYTKKLHRKFNKRFEENPGLKLKPKRHIMVGVDTSGSVSNSELKEFFHEIYHMIKMGSEVTVVQCDAAIHSVTKYKKGLEDKISITGRGGTSFDPFISYANEHANRFSCLIVMTDGEAPAPDESCKLKTLWVHSSKSNINEQLKGFKIKLN